MSDDNAVLYSLKDMPANTSQPAAKAASPQANIKPKTKSSVPSWDSSESAGSLLAGILDETAEDAQAEERRVQEELERKQRESREAERREEARKLDDANRRIQEEADRQQRAHQKRTSLIRAIEGPSEEELAAKARAEDESRRREEMEAKLAAAERARHQAEQRASAAAKEAKVREQQRLDALAAGPAPAAKKSNTGLFIGLGLAAVLVVGILATVAVIALGDSSQQVAGQTFPKTTYKATTVASSFTEQGFVAIPKPKREEVEDPADAVAPTGARGRGGRRGAAARGKAAGGAKDAGGKGKGKGKGGRKFNFGGDPFGGGGGIVF